MNPRATVYANIDVGVGDRTAAAPRARYDLFSYAVVDAYARSFTRAGFGAAVQAIRAAHQAADRAGALAAVPNEMVDAINVTGDQALVAGTIVAYRRAGRGRPGGLPPHLGHGRPGRAGCDAAGSDHRGGTRCQPGLTRIRRLACQAAGPLAPVAPGPASRRRPARPGPG